MKFFIPFLVSVVPLVLHLAATTQAAPLAVQGDLRARDPTDSLVDDLVARALNLRKLSQTIQAIQKGQTARKSADDKKKALNSKTIRNLKKPKTTDPAKMAPKDKQAQKGIGQAITKAVKDKKDKNRSKLEAKKKTPAQAAKSKEEKAQRRKDRKATGAPAPPPKAPGKKAVEKKDKKAITSAERNQVKDAFKKADRKKKEIGNLPGRKDTFEVGKNKFSGKDVRQGVFNSYLHKGHPVGDSPANKNPKTFNNSPYSATHPDPNLRNKPAIPAPGYRKGREYPIKTNSHNGYTGSGPVGAGRVVTYKDGAKKEVAVIGHDASKGGDPTDHYLAKHTKAKRELIEDWDM
ncbi:hypothetical protein H1R20_g14331, partial [Candolleomyces eurysporus]